MAMVRDRWRLAIALFGAGGAISFGFDSSFFVTAAESASSVRGNRLATLRTLVDSFGD
jgi:hypothetical protein